MGKKLIVTERQLKVITQHINEGVINEGFKEITLGLLLLAGANLSGQNKAIAQSALKDPSVVSKLDDALSDINKLESMVDGIEGNLPDASDIIRNNVDKIKASLSYMKNND